MQRKKRCFAALVACLLLLPLVALAESADAVLGTINGTQAVKEYAEEAVPQEVLDSILAAGISAPSAVNRQPWRFTVVTDAETVGRLSRSSTGVAIIVSGDYENTSFTDFDCGLATGNMYLAAHALGLGANIYASSVQQAEEMRDALEIPEGYQPVAVMTVGYPVADAATGASARNALEDVVNYAP